MIPLHLHTTFSYLDGFGTAEQFAKVFVTKSITAAAVTDHGKIGAFVSWEKMLTKNNIKPIFGCEFYITCKKNITNGVAGYKHITVLAKNLVGYKNLCKLVTLAHTDSHFYKRPRIHWGELLEYHDGLIVLSGCPVGLLADKDVAIGDKMRWINLMGDTFKGDFYFEIHCNNFEVTLDMNIEVIRLSLKYPDIKILCANDVHYPDRNDAEVQDVMWCVGQGKTMDDPARYSYLKSAGPVLFVHSKQEALDRVQELYGKDVEIAKVFDRAIERTYEIPDQCDVKLPKAEAFSFNGKPAEENLTLLKSLIGEGMKRRKTPLNDVYKNRIIHELNLISKKGFVDYFLCIADMVTHAKDNLHVFVGPGRGSVGGSLIAYLLRITELDPVVHDLLIDRFLDESRSDPPDIDLDFEDEKRDLVKAYLASKYGQNKVADVLNYSKYHGPSLLNDVSRIFKLDDDMIKIIKERIPERDLKDERYFKTVEDTLNQPDFEKYVHDNPCLRYAAMMEGQIRQHSTHASGVVVSSISPLEEHFAKYDKSLFSLDKDEAESMGFLKIDILGVTQLTMIRKMCDIILDRYEKKLDLYKISLDDLETMKLFESADGLGVFQFEGEAVRSLTRRYKPTKFSDLVVLNALSRPGPIESGGAQDLIARKNQGVVPPVHPIYDAITKDNYGCIVFQEDVMALCKFMAKMPPEKVYFVRKTIAKSGGQEILSKYNDFIEGCVNNGVSQEIAKSVWQDIIKFGGYGFNKAHAVAYSITAYWCQYIKAHYPDAFYEVYLQYGDELKKVQSIGILKNRGFSLECIDINLSGEFFSIKGREIYPGFSDVTGIGTINAREIIKRQPYKNYDDFMKRCECGKHIKELLKNLGAFDGKPLSSTNEKCFWIKYDFSLKRGSVHTSISDLREGMKTRLLAKIDSIKVKVSEQDGRQHANIYLLDDTGKVTGIVGRNQYEIMKDKILKLKKNMMVDLDGSVGFWKDKVMFYVNDIIETGV